MIWNWPAKEVIRENLKSKPEALLSGILILVAVILVLIALWPGHPVLKALTIAWVVLP